MHIVRTDIHTNHSLFLLTSTINFKTFYVKCVPVRSFKPGVCGGQVLGKVRRMFVARCIIPGMICTYWYVGTPLRCDQFVCTACYYVLYDMIRTKPDLISAAAVHLGETKRFPFHIVSRAHSLLSLEESTVAAVTWGTSLRM